MGHGGDVWRLGVGRIVLRRDPCDRVGACGDIATHVVVSEAPLWARRDATKGADALLLFNLITK